MSRFWQHFVTNGGAADPDPPPAGEPPPDSELLDAFSRAVVSS